MNKQDSGAWKLIAFRRTRFFSYGREKLCTHPSTHRAPIAKWRIERKIRRVLRKDLEYLTAVMARKCSSCGFFYWQSLIHKRSFPDILSILDSQCVEPQDALISCPKRSFSESITEAKSFRVFKELVIHHCLLQILILVISNNANSRHL